MMHLHSDCIFLCMRIEEDEYLSNIAFFVEKREVVESISLS